jgi:hypothetical protein
MSELQEISVVIDPAGNVEIRVQGVKGTRCLDLTAQLERDLGEKISSREHTDEYDELPLVSQDADRLSQS